MTDPRTTKSGSALVLTLMVVGLLLLLVLSLTAHVRMELRSVQANFLQSLANKNAKLGLDLAVARLQEVAGPDQRVTATAGALGSSTHASKQWLTGVWDTRSGASSDPTWLISTADKPGFTLSAEMPTSTSIVLVGAGTQSLAAPQTSWVRAPRINFNEGGKAGSYAWWVGDEGVKASLALRNPFENPTPASVAGLHETEIRRLRYAVPFRNAQELAFTTPLDFETPGLNPLLGRLLDLNHFVFIGNNENPEKTGGFHHYTLNARGLLTHPLNGGVKIDLSQAPEELGDGFVRYMNFPSYLQTPSNSNFLVKKPEDLRRMHVMVPPADLNPSDGDIVHSVVPIITDFGLQFTPRPILSANTQESMAMRFVLELWNPYSSGLVAEDLMLEIRGLQPMTVKVGALWSRTFNLATIFGDPLTIRLNREQYHTSKLLAPNAYDVQAHGPGRVLYWISPDLARTPPNTASFASNNSTQSILNVALSPQPGFPPNTSPVSYVMPETRLTLTLRRAPENGGQILARYENFIYDAVDSGTISTLSQWASRWLTFRFRMSERGTTYAGDRSLWLKHRDKRSPNPTFGDDSTRDTHIMHETATSYAPDDSALNNDLALRQDQNTFYFDRIMSGSAWSTDTRRDISLFELPRQPLISIGQLQHLHIAGHPPYSIGNPWGGSTWNRLFDDYFLSGVQTGISMPDFSVTLPVLPHPRLSFAPPEYLGLSKHSESRFNTLRGKSAAALQVEGQFNLNSISPDAWRVILGGNLFPSFTHVRRDTNLHDASHNDENDIVTTDNTYPSGFTRFPQSIQELFDVNVAAMDRATGDANDRNIRTMKAGIAFLHPRTGVSGIAADYNASDKDLLREFASALAEAVQTRIQTKGRPYFSMTEFITETFKNGEPLLESILKGDVNAVKFPRLQAGELRSYTAPVSGALVRTAADERSPAWLSQADVLSAIAPFLSTRSDTFTIRSYGDVLDPNTGAVLSKAWCEALVQRTITPVNPVTSLTEYGDNPASPLGRHFKVISFRWLNESDI